MTVCRHDLRTTTCRLDHLRPRTLTQTIVPTTSDLATARPVLQGNATMRPARTPTYRPTRPPTRTTEKCQIGKTYSTGAINTTGVTYQIGANTTDATIVIATAPRAATRENATLIVIPTGPIGHRRPAAITTTGITTNEIVETSIEDATATATVSATEHTTAGPNPTTSATAIEAEEATATAVVYPSVRPAVLPMVVACHMVEVRAEATRRAWAAIADGRGVGVRGLSAGRGISSVRSGIGILMAGVDVCMA